VPKHAVLLACSRPPPLTGPQALGVLYVDTGPHVVPLGQPTLYSLYTIRPAHSLLHQAPAPATSVPLPPAPPTPALAAATSITGFP
jgi:hypothetical protein